MKTFTKPMIAALVLLCVIELTNGVLDHAPIVYQNWRTDQSTHGAD